MMLAECAGLTFRNDGGPSIWPGSLRDATVNAVCTSSEAPSMFRLRSNWMMIVLMPSAEVDVSDVMPAMVESCRSIGPATEAPMVSGLAPGSVAVIWMVGKSTAGSAATDNSREPKIPNTMSAAVISVVIPGRRMQVSEMFTSGSGLAFADGNARLVGQEEMSVGDD